MKLEKNMYVRTKNGVITKIEQIVDDEIHFNINPIFSDGECLGYNWFYIKDVEKASHNIIDLIEVDDIVVSLNASNILEYNLLTLSNIDELKDLWNIQGNIKSIVTKEQFEAIRYEL